jgi:hypothetical protein
MYEFILYGTFIYLFMHVFILMKCYIWSIALYGAETWTFQAVDEKQLESFEI